MVVKIRSKPKAESFISIYIKEYNSSELFAKIIN